MSDKLPLLLDKLYPLCLTGGYSKLKLQQFCLATLMKQPNEIFRQISLSITKQLIVILSTKQSVKLIKAIPAIGGVMGAVIDRIITYRIGKFSKSQFGQFY